MTWRDHLRGAAVALVGFAFLILGMPGMDLLRADRWMPGSAARERTLAEFWGPVAVGAADVNRAVRVPIVRVLTPLQRPLRMAQSWGLYGGGAPSYRVFEIHVDDALVYRSHDPDHQWLNAELQFRRIRPVVDAHCTGISKNSRGLVSWIRGRVRRDFPEAKGLVTQCVRRPRRQSGPVEVLERTVATAPDWRLRR